MKITFAQKTAAERKSLLEALPEQFKALSNEDLDGVLADINAQGKTILASAAPSIDQVDEVEALTAAKQFATAEKTARAAAVADAEKRFAAAQTAFSVNDGVETGPDETDEPEESEPGSDDADDADEPEESEEDPEDEAEVEAAGENPFDKKRKKAMDDEEDPEKKVVSASASQRIRPGTAARKAGAAARRPAVKAAAPVVITASADIPGVAMGSTLPDLSAVAKAAISRVGGFPKFNSVAAERAHDASGGEPVLNKFGVASFDMEATFDKTMVASGNEDQNYSAIQAAVKDYETALTASISQADTLSAAGWCAPSEVSYGYLADYVIDGLFSTPQVGAPRGGLMTTTGPALADEYALDGSDFGFSQTEAQAEARAVKTCETIICPEFVDHRLDAVGYCWKIPILTQKAYPELVTDALRLSSVLFAHKMNTRYINAALALATSVSATGLGASFTDTLEALAIVAVKERRRWNVGENKVMEVKMPVWAKEVFRADISRRPFHSGGPVTDAMINAEFTSRNLAPEYVTDWAMLTGSTPVFASTFPVMIYPAGTFVKAVEPVINLSTVYDAASLSVNEFTGVFFEQGSMLFQAGYGATKFNIPVCTAGLVGAPILDCHPESANWAGQKAAVVA